MQASVYILFAYLCVFVYTTVPTESHLDLHQLKVEGTPRLLCGAVHSEHSTYLRVEVHPELYMLSRPH